MLPKKREGKTGTGCRIEKETYTNVLARSRKDKRLSLADRAFLSGLINILDITGKDYCRLTWRELMKEMTLSMGAVVG